MEVIAVSETLQPNAEMITPTEVGATPLPDQAPKQIVKVYGLIGYTRSIDLEFEKEYLVPDNVFIFEGKRYKIASIIELENGQPAINAVSVEYSLT